MTQTSSNIITLRKCNGVSTKSLLVYISPRTAMAFKAYSWLVLMLLPLACTVCSLFIPGTGEKGWKCTANSSDISFTVERCNKTSKLILKVKITEDYTVNLPKPIESTTAATVYDTLEEYDSNWDYFDHFVPEDDILNFPDEIITELPYWNPWKIPTIVPDHFNFNEYVENTEASLMNSEELRQAHYHFCKEASIDDDMSLKEQGVHPHPRYEEVPGVGFYRFHTTPRNWEDARRICEQEGGYLAVINSEEEAVELNKIQDRCPKITEPYSYAYIYLGLHDRFNEGKFETVFGEPLEGLGYVRWGFLQPDNAHFYGEDCMAMNQRGLLHDVPCSTKLPYFCEHN